jgi:hypothetical protein
VDFGTLVHELPFSLRAKQKLWFDFHDLASSSNLLAIVEHHLVPNS